jgi:hypothetical protein
LTFEQIGQVIDVFDGKKSGENEEYRAGETLSMMPNDFLNMICIQADHEATVKNLIAGYLDFPDKVKHISMTIDNFDISKYV